ncbi:IclR family transcriptional regulator [Xanthobacteraceae bacterium A53D]
MASAPKSPRHERAGTQSIERALRVLRILASTNYASGVSIQDLEEASGLNRSTLYRIIRALRNEGFVERHPASGMFFLGMDFLSLGSASMNRFNLRELARPCLVRIAEQTEDTVFLSIRSGADSICVDRQEGSFPIKALTLNIGDRRPLGVGAGALALLAFLPRVEMEDIVARNALRYPSNPAMTAENMLMLVRRSREDGHAFNDGQVLKSMCAVGVPVRGQQRRQPLAALSIAAISDRMGAGRRAELVAILEAEAQALGAALVARGAQPLGA